MTPADPSTGPQVRSITPQFLVDDLDAAIAYYRDRLGFELEFVFQGFYASVRRGGAQLHLKHAAKSREDRALREANDHLDAYLVVADVASLFAEVTARGARVISPLQERPWACDEFWVMDADGYILAFSEPFHDR